MLDPSEVSHEQVTTVAAVLEGIDLALRYFAKQTIVCPVPLNDPFQLAKHLKFRILTLYSTEARRSDVGINVDTIMVALLAGCPILDLRAVGEEP